MSVNEIVLKERDTLRKTKINEAQRRKQAENIRRRENEQMAEHDPSAAAKRQMRHKPYQAAALIREQGEQMRRESVDEFVARKHGTNAVKGAFTDGESGGIQKIRKCCDSSSGKRLYGGFTEKGKE